MLQQQQADAMYQYCIENSKPVVAVEDRLIIFNNNGLTKLTTSEPIKKGQSIHLNGIGTDCKSMSDDRIPLIGDEVVVSHYTNSGHYMLETKNAIYTNIRSLRDRVMEHTRQQAEERLMERWGQSLITANIAPNMLSTYGHLPEYPTSDESHLIDLASESLPSGFDRAAAFNRDSWLFDRKIERYQEGVNNLLTNVIQECVDKNIPIIKWNSNEIKFDNFEGSIKETSDIPKYFNGNMIPQSGQEATLPNHCMMLDENGEWGPVPSEMRDIFVGETQNERSNFVMITDAGLITNYDIDGIVEQVLEMKQDINGYDSQDLSDRQ